MLKKIIFAFVLFIGFFPVFSQQLFDKTFVGGGLNFTGSKSIDPKAVQNLQIFWAGQKNRNYFRIGYQQFYSPVGNPYGSNLKSLLLGYRFYTSQSKYFNTFVGSDLKYGKGTGLWYNEKLMFGSFGINLGLEFSFLKYFTLSGQVGANAGYYKYDVTSMGESSILFDFPAELNLAINLSELLHKKTE